MQLINIFSNLDPFTITTGIVSICTAVLSFVLAVAEGRDNKKILFGLTAKTLKGVSTYITLVATLLTLYLGWDHQVRTAAAEGKKTKQADSLQQARFDSTLKTITRTLEKQDSTLAKQGTTLIKQDSTLAATGHILSSQRTELANQAIMFGQQRVAFDTASKILRKQVEIQDSLKRSLVIGTSNQRTLDTTSADVNGISFPLTGGMAALVTARLYIKGLSEVFHDTDTGTHLLMKENQPIDTCLKKHFGKLNINARKKYWDFFSFSNVSWLERCFEIGFGQGSPDNRIVYTNLKASDWTGNFIVFSNILYNEREGYIQWEVMIQCGGVSENPSSVKSLSQVMQHADLRIKLRFPRQKIYELPVSNRKSRTVEIAHFEIAAIRQVFYGNIGQRMVNAPIVRPVSARDEPLFFKQYWGEEIPPGEEWRYAGAEVHISQ